jgi:hypothetical protein
MKNERGRQRLDELFSNLEVLIPKPVGSTLEIPPESERPASQIVEMEYASPIDKVVTSRGDNSLAIPSPLKSEVQPTIEMQSAPLPNRRLTTEKQGPPDLKDFGIGVVSGTLVTGIILASTSQMDIFNNLGRFVLFGGELLFGILGAFSAKSFSKTSREVWIGAIEWSLIPVWIGLFIVLMIYLLSFTNLFSA